VLYKKYLYFPCIPSRRGLGQIYIFTAGGYSMLVKHYYVEYGLHLQYVAKKNSTELYVKKIRVPCKNNIQNDGGGGGGQFV
jgi:hypothetical protein